MRAIFRIWVAGELILREEVDLDSASDIPSLGDGHSELVANETRPWLAEVEFPDLPAEERYTRFGTDVAGMIDPQVFRP